MEGMFFGAVGWSRMFFNRCVELFVVWVFQNSVGFRFFMTVFFGSVLPVSNDPLDLVILFATNVDCAKGDQLAAMA